MADTTISSLNTVNTLSANNFIPISDGTNTTKLGTDSLFGFRNRLINGDLRVWQRGTSFSNSNGYTADRWFVNRATGNNGITVNKQGTYNSTLRITRNQGDTSTTHLDFRQVIETQNCYDLAGKQVTFSFNAAKTSNFTPSTCYIEINYSTVADTPSNAESWISLGFRAFNPTTSFQKFIETYAIPSNALTIMARIISASYVGTAPANDAIEITQLQLEEGNTATPFEFRPIGVELALCQRYYFRVTRTATTPFDWPLFDAGFWSNTYHAFYKYPVVMRTSSIAFEASDPSTFWYHVGGLENGSVTSININAFADGCRITGTVVYNSGAGRVGQILARNGYTAYIGFNAEL